MLEKLTAGSALEIIDALVLLQQLEPAGVGARNLARMFDCFNRAVIGKCFKNMAYII